MNRQVLYKIALCLLMILSLGLSIFAIFKETSMNIFWLGIIYLAVIIFNGLYYLYFQTKSTRQRDSGLFVIGPENYEFALLSAVGIILLSVATIKTLNNYFYPDAQVYQNVDHHIISAKGIEIENDHNFNLAENSNNAFWDNKSLLGKLSIEAATDSDVVLKLQNFTRGIYINHFTNEKCDKRILVNAENMLHFYDGDTIFLKCDAHIYKFYTETSKDSANYYLECDGKKMLSKEHHILTHGLSLNDVLRGIVTPDSTDFSSLNIIRPKILPLIKNRDKYKTYAPIGYCIEVQNTFRSGLDNIYSIKVNNGDWRELNDYTESSIHLKHGDIFNIGFQATSNNQMYFNSVNGKLQLLYKLPQMHYIPKPKDPLTYNTISIHTSESDFAQIDDLGNLDQVILFDVFSHYSNTNNLNAISFTYKASNTTQSLSGKYKSLFNNDGTTKNITSGEYFENTEFENGRGRWLISLYDLKSTSPYLASNIKLWILGFGIALAILMLFGAGYSFMRSENSASKNTFTLIEMITYMVTLYLVSVKWLLLWRVSVFPPVEHIGVHEFSIFRCDGLSWKENNLICLESLMVTFVILCFFAKLTIYYWDQCNEFILLVTNKTHSGYIILKNKLRETTLWSKLKESRFHEYLLLMTKKTQGIYNNLIIQLKKLFEELRILQGRLKESETRIHYIPLTVVEALILICRIITSLDWLTFVISVISLGIAIPLKSMPWICITWLMVSYIGLIALSNYRILGHYKLSDQKISHLWFSSPTKQLINIIFLSFAFVGFSIIIDAGFGIIFLTFAIICIIWYLHEYVTMYLSDESYSIFKDLCCLGLFLSFVALLFFYKKLFNIICTPTLGTWMTTALISCILFYIVFKCILNASIRNRLFWVCMILFSVILSVGTNKYLSDYVNHSKHTKQRIAVHFMTPEESLEEIQTETDHIKYMQAAVNHAIIKWYAKHGEKVKIWGEEGCGYFKLVPHTNIGATWNAQLTDISLVRFIIAEHGRYIPLIIIMMFICMTLYGALLPVYHRWARVVLLQIPLFFTIESLLIWMTNTRRFIFLGQDFPLISINSRLVLVIFFTLFFIWLSMAFIEKTNFYKLFEDSDDMDDPNCENLWRYEVAKKDGTKLTLILILCLLFCVITDTDSTHANAIPNNNTLFETGNLFKHVEDVINNTIDPLLRVYQLDYAQNNISLRESLNNISKKNVNLRDKKAMREDVCKAYKTQTNVFFTNQLQTFITNFNQQMNIDSILSQQDSIKMVQRVWSNFCAEQSSNNSSSNILHARIISDTIVVHSINQSRIFDTIQIKRIKLFTFKGFYKTQLPDSEYEPWRGNITTLAESASSNGTSTTDNATAYKIPKSWTGHSDDDIIFTTNNRSSIITNFQEIDMRKNYLSALAWNSTDMRNVDSRIKEAVHNLKPHKDYLARNILVNNKTRFVYSKDCSNLFWVRNFAEQLNAQHKFKNRNSHHDNSNTDIELTLSPKLNQNIYDKLESTNVIKEGCVIVANGDGDVIALTSFDRDYKHDPNNNKEIAQLGDSLYMYGVYGSDIERRHFGNKNLLHIKSGPGSTQKPLVWTSVAYSVKFPWDTLSIHSYNGAIDDADNSHYKIKRFADINFRYRDFKPLKSDENGGNKVNLITYMKRSSNVYNAVMAYIGSFSTSQIKNFEVNDKFIGDSDEYLFRVININTFNVDSIRKHFPIMTLSRENIIFNDMPNFSKNAQEESLLNKKMTDMFLLNDKYSQSFSSINYTSPADSIIDLKHRYNGYVYVEKSKFDNRGGDESDYMELGIRSTAIGASKVWHITPWKMAESYGRMASLDHNYTLNIVKHKPLTHQLFADITDEYKNARQMQFKGMSDIFFDGTASRIIYPRENNKTIVKTQAGKKYYIYAKTGTISESNQSDRHRFAVIISKQDITEMGISHLNELKFYVIYFALSCTQQWALYKDVIKEIIESDEFKKYMSQD